MFETLKNLRPFHGLFVFKTFFNCFVGVGVSMCSWLNDPETREAFVGEPFVGINVSTLEGTVGLPSQTARNALTVQLS